MEKFQRHLAAIDGSDHWAVIGPLFDDPLDGRLMRVEPLDPAVYSEPVERSK